MPPAAGSQVPYFHVADPGFSVRSEEVDEARKTSWYAETSFGLAVLRYDQGARLLRHPAVRQGSVAWLAHNGITSGLLASWWASWMLHKEGDDHSRLRRLLSPAFSRRPVVSLVPRFRELATELIDSFAASGRCEFMADFAEPYAAGVLGMMLGIPDRHEWRNIAADAATVGLAMGVNVRNELPRIEAALANLYGFADALIADRSRSPREDFVTQMVRARYAEHGLTESELRDSLVLLIFGGFDTTRNQLGLAMQTFIDHPAQWRRLALQPELASAAVEEVMRVNPTTTWVTREALADFTFDGVEIKAGTTLHLFCESAGTDPRVVPAATFDIAAADRPPHFAFGGGAHYCLGHLLAREDLAVALTVLARQLRDPRVAGDAVWLPTSGNTGPARLPVAFAPGH
ncbi:MAG: cytochrome P450 [Streptosporangiaceae bacterium]